MSQSPLLSIRRRRPFEIARSRSGTLALIVKLALSAGTLSQGIQAIVPCGSPTAKAPSPVRIQPSGLPSASTIRRGWPW